MPHKQSEIELLLCCARAQPDSEITLLIQDLVQKDLDWEYLVQTALRHRVMPLLYTNLKKACPQSVPQDAMNKLQRYFLVNTARNYLFADRLLKILNVFEYNHIVAVPFKGPVLAENIYGDIALRQFVDLDILVYPHDVLKAHKLIVSLGYRSDIKLNSKQSKEYLKTEYSFTYSDDKSRIFVELHWQLLGRYSSCPYDLNNIEINSSATLDNKIVEQFSLEDLLLYQCLHSSKHFWNILENICCIAELINSHEEINWSRIEALARKMRCERMLFLGLFLAYTLFKITLPGHVMNRMNSDPALRSIAKGVYDNIFYKSRDSENPPGSDFSLFHMKIRDRFSERVRYGLSLVLKPSREEWRILPLPPSFSFLHYFFRPIRLAAGFGHSLLKH
jgi:hypothetical protein